MALFRTDPVNDADDDWGLLESKLGWRWECAICRKDKSHEPWFCDDTQLHLRCCGHDLCRGCLRHMVRDGRVHCPFCNHLLHDLDLAAAAPTNVEWFEVEQRRIWREGGCRGLRCGRTGCYGVLEVSVLGGVQEAERPRNVLCPVCSDGYCGRCRVPWSEQHQCEDIQERQRRAEEWRAAEELRRAGLRPGHELVSALDVRLRELSSDHRPCPGCGVPTMRDGGCNMMACPNCRCQWCYACGRKDAGCRSFLCTQLAPAATAHGPQQAAVAPAVVGPREEPPQQEPAEAAQLAAQRAARREVVARAAEVRAAAARAAATEVAVAQVRTAL